MKEVEPPRRKGAEVGKYTEKYEDESPQIKNQMDSGGQALRSDEGNENFAEIGRAPVPLRVSRAGWRLDGLWRRVGEYVSPY
jgi:hypothetical protein